MRERFPAEGAGKRGNLRRRILGVYVAGGVGRGENSAAAAKDATLRYAIFEYPAT